jgi:hypothetical protein
MRAPEAPSLSGAGRRKPARRDPRARSPRPGVDERSRGLEFALALLAPGARRLLLAVTLPQHAGQSGRRFRPFAYGGTAATIRLQVGTIPAESAWRQIVVLERTDRQLWTTPEVLTTFAVVPSEWVFDDRGEVPGVSRTA